MKIALLSGAYGNAGDSLIEFRAKNLLEEVFAGSAVDVISRKELGTRFEEIDGHDLIVFSGGPVYQQDISRNFDVSCAARLTKKIRIVGGGWKGYGRSQNLPYQYPFEERTYRFFEKVNAGHGLACRDWYSVKALKNAGLGNAVMTGCPAWYDPEFVHCLEIREPENAKPLICISDPANPENAPYILPLIRHVSECFPAADIKLVLHRGRETPDYERLAASVREQGIAELALLTPSAEAFSIYDRCDLHIGFRVHAHIYNLSRRHRSVLIEEDGRGAGVNEALGLPALLAYNDELQLADRKVRKLLLKLRPEKNRFLLSQLDEYLDMLEKTGGVYFENAFRLMEQYYRQMQAFLQQ